MLQEIKKEYGITVLNGNYVYNIALTWGNFTLTH